MASPYPANEAKVARADARRFTGEQTTAFAELEDTGEPVETFLEGFHSARQAEDHARSMRAQYERDAAAYRARLAEGQS